MADEIGGRPFAIRDKWIIGGDGNWDYLTIDPAARQLFIAHQTEVQVVDLAGGRVSGRITGFGEARSILLDPAGQLGYVTDSGKRAIKIFNRRTLQIEATIPLICSPRSMTLAGQENLLVAICGSPTPPHPLTTAPLRRTRRGTILPATPYQNAVPAKGNSQIAFINPEASTVLGYITVSGDFRMAQAGSAGEIYVTVGPAQRPWDMSITNGGETMPPRIAHFDAEALAGYTRKESAKLDSIAGSTGSGPPIVRNSGGIPHLSFMDLPSTCPSPQGLAVDSHNARLFIACDNQNLLVLDSTRGSVLSTLTTGPGTDAIAYDENHGLIFTANGGGYGSLTVVRRHQTDDYAVIQNLPTMERARTLAVDQSTGQVYLVTDLHGVNLRSTPVKGIGSLKPDAVAGSFQVLVVGN
jgi:DNA-binding beta-propeller fold protein YncE